MDRVVMNVQTDELLHKTGVEEKQATVKEMDLHAETK